jgi:hypothetical protein
LREFSWPTRKIKPLKTRRLAKRIVGYGRERKNHAKMKECPQDIDDNKQARKLTWVKFPLSDWMLKITQPLILTSMGYY